MASDVLISRIFAVFAAALLVGAFGLMVLTPDGMTLDQGVYALDPRGIAHLRGMVGHLLGAAAWGKLFMPVLIRPVWMIPLCTGLVCAGVAASTGTPTESPRSTRTRS
jgi:hypothetical protein